LKSSPLRKGFIFCQFCVKIKSGWLYRLYRRLYFGYGQE